MKTTAPPTSKTIAPRYLPLALICSLALPNICFAQARGSTTQTLFGTSQRGNPAGASVPGADTGFTMGQNLTNSYASRPGDVDASTVGFYTTNQKFMPGGLTGFIGASSLNTTNSMSRVGTPSSVQPGAIDFALLSNLMSQSRQNQFNQQQTQIATAAAGQSPVPFHLHLAPGTQSTSDYMRVMNSARSSRPLKIPALSHVGQVTASLEGQIAVVRGTVLTESDRQLAEGLANLEPGVLAVRNEIVLGPPPSPPRLMFPPTRPPAELVVAPTPSPPVQPRARPQ